MQNQSISLVGLMGAGKTTVGRALAKRLGWQFIDTDHEVEARTGVSIPTIFEIEGEAGFRRREARVIEDLAQLSSVVLATGGGAVLDEGNRQHLQRNSLVVYLDAEPESLMARLRHDRNRPLLQVPDPLARLRELHAVRDPLYREIADLVVNANRLGATEIIKQILSELPPRCHA